MYYAIFGNLRQNSVYYPKGKGFYWDIYKCSSRQASEYIWANWIVRWYLIPSKISRHSFPQIMANYIFGSPSRSYMSRCPLSVVIVLRPSVISNIKIPMLLTILQCFWLSGSPSSHLQCCHLSGSASGYLAVLPSTRQCYRLSGSTASCLTMLLSIWQCCCLSDSAVGNLAVLPAIWQCQLWPYGHKQYGSKYGHDGYPWKEDEKTNSAVKESSDLDVWVKSYGQN